MNPKFSNFSAPNPRSVSMVRAMVGGDELQKLSASQRPPRGNVAWRKATEESKRRGGMMTW